MGKTVPTRLRGLDGLRALAVLSVMAFHFGVHWIPGGFLGVDAFFVLSGYLITTLLVSEYRNSSRVNLRAFWARRARRLLPCLAIVVIAAALYVRFVAPAGSYPAFRMQALSALFYFSNWYQIAASTHYFVVTSAPSPLTQTWSLAIEEQFYIVWPLVVALVLRWARRSAPSPELVLRKALRALLLVSALGVVASALEMALLYGPEADTTRLYFGTDTHAQSLLVGVALACALALWHTPSTRHGLAPDLDRGRGRWVSTGVGIAGMVGLLVLSHILTGQTSFTYRGGFLVADLAAASLIAGLVLAPSGPLTSMMDLAPLAWIGTISYGLYLWHYPLFLLLTPDRTGLSGWSLLVLRYGVSVTVAAASYYLVERPVIHGDFWRSFKALLPAFAGVGAVLATVLATTAVTAGAAVPVHAFHPTRRSALVGDQPTPAPPPPPEVVVLGDSTALTLGYALAATAPVGTQVVNGGLFGCGLAIATYASSTPTATGLTMTPACNSATPPSAQWPAVDARRVAGTAPGDQVLFLAGHWETQSLLIDGHWTDILHRSFQHYEEVQMRLAVSIGTAHGAHFDFLTMACMDASYPYGEPMQPSDSPQRREIYNGLLGKVAAEFPGQVSVIHYGSILCPTGKFTQYLDGVEVRTPDGIHTPAYVPGNIFAGNSTEAVADQFYQWLSPRLWPLILDPPTSETGMPAPVVGQNRGRAARI